MKINNKSLIKQPMKKASLLISSFSFCVSFLLFSSSYILNLPFPYPYLFYTLALIWILGLLLSFEIKVVSSLENQKNVYFLFSLIIIIGMLSSFYFQNFSILPVLSKIITIFICLLSFTLGDIATRNKDCLILFAKYIMFFSLIGFGISFVDDNLNKNWIGLLILYSLIFKVYIENRSPLFVAVIFSLSAIIIFFTLLSRGVTLALIIPSFIISLFIITKKINKIFFKKIIYFTGFVIFLSSLTTPLVGSYLYNSNLYWKLDSISRELSSKNLDSSRLERWQPAVMKTIKDSPVLGFGIEAAIGRTIKTENVGSAIHNLWVEVFFRFGLLGLIFYIGFFLWLFKKINKRNSFYGGIAIISFSVSLSVYGLGGFTHWPGTFAFWFLLSILAYSKPIDTRPEEITIS
ncbi:MAG: hypothetical protein D3906_00025 [Candidatus Electrothrix sp. AUS1_2]|nr:hypothetical protein [Candidatus Electrothrix sp. AUS1_2]